ncbi:c-type cytochrome [Methyloversatilis discipulorum]|uniref:c-type cytochrome n=1 Tax=Methyloversatilis discipulorum TaxID=1119528 RepID=UPI001A41688C|nr:c-type cytochrome [Methyloversatilis discipulorum]MBL8467865.1 cytochrome c5 family protein [Methyloversatilis discipulorum]
MSDAHEEHETLIKTPQQLIAVVVLSFVVFVGLGVLVAQYVSSGYKGASNPDPEVVSRAIQPVAQLALGEPEAKGPKTGEQIYKGACAACHDAGMAGAPKLGDSGAWASRIATGLDALVKSAINGKGAMPAKGGNASLSDEEITRAVAYMGNKAGANFAEPKAADAADAAAEPAADASAAPAAPVEAAAIAAPAYEEKK